MADADAHSLDHTLLTRDAALLKDTVREAGALAQSMFRTELRKWTKGASSPVSEADIAVNDLLESRLRAATPDYGWLSEESADDVARLSRRLTWIVDPIDGTRNYLGGHDEWCVSVALVQDASPVLAAVFAPSSDEFFFAARGQGTKSVVDLGRNPDPDAHRGHSCHLLVGEKVCTVVARGGRSGTLRQVVSLAFMTVCAPSRPPRTAIDVPSPH